MKKLRYIDMEGECVIKKVMPLNQERKQVQDTVITCFISIKKIKYDCFSLKTNSACSIFVSLPVQIVHKLCLFVSVDNS